MFSISFLELVIHDTRTYRKEWRIVRDYGETTCSLTSMGFMPGEQSSVSVRDFLREGGTLARCLSDRRSRRGLGRLHRRPRRGL